MAKIEGLLEVNRDFCKQQMAEKASLALLPNGAVLPKQKGGFSMAKIRLRDIEMVRAVMQEKNFSRAAEKLYISQPALSQAIKRLE